ncbi:MAG: AGE family epimerase/isomerase [Actinomycetales bacterium]|nr:AGE family epimerase/isomerase [Actinomycetales bacterium]
MTAPPARPVPADDVRPVPPDDAWLAAETRRLLDGAARSAVPAGGFAWLDGDGRPDPSRGLQLWVNARMTHVFSLGVLLGREGDAALVDHGVAALAGPFRDPVHDGWFSRLDGGSPASTTKAAYEHMFVLLAASSATVAGRPGAAELLDDACAVVDARFWDPEAGRVVEEWNQDWTVLDGYRGANANMHAVEAFLAVADATGDRRWRDRAESIVTGLVHEGARHSGWRVPEHFDSAWRMLPDYNRDRPDHPFRPYGATPGHGLEWARLLLHLDAAVRRATATPASPVSGEPVGRGRSEPPSWLVPAAVELFDRAVAEGWDADRGGFVYTTDWDGTPVVTERFHWVVAEAVDTAAALARVTGEDRFARWYAVFWDYARRVLVEPAGLGWLHEVDADGRVACRTWEGRPDWYHAVQATLIPRLPLAPTLATALRDGLLGA